MADKIKKPIKQGVAKVPVIMQLEILECGAACLCMVLAYYDKWVPLEKVREDCGVSRDGSNASGIAKAAKHYGLDVKENRWESDTLKAEGTFPCIIHWNGYHFVVLDGFRGDDAIINDPAKGLCTVSKEEFNKSFTGVCLTFEPTAEFEPSGKRKNIFSFVKKYLKGTGAALVITLLTSTIAALTGFIQPAFSRVFMDYLLSNKSPNWAVPFLCMLIVFDIIIIVSTAVQNIYSLRINGKMAAIGNSTYMWKVLRLPMKFYFQRRVEDIKERQASNATIANTLINTFAPLVLNVFMMIFYFIIMIRYNVMLTIVGLGSIVLTAFVSQYIAIKRSNISRVAIRDDAVFSAETTSGIDMIETIKASGAENGYFKKWAGYQASANSNRIKILKINQYLGMIPTFLSKVADNAILYIGVFLVMNGQFTVGMVMAFQGLLSSFMAPASKIIEAAGELQEMRVQMERLDDVLEYPDDIVFADDSYEEGQHKLSGNIELKNVTFGYAPLEDPLIKNFNLTITPGKSVAIVGFSGCGKSTITKILSGINKQWSGDVLFDGKPLNRIPKNVFHASVAVVDQSIVLFEDTISNNIKMWDESIKDTDVVKAAHDAMIDNDILQKPGGYQHKLAEGGKDFSGGQRQRIEIARALVQNPSIIIMDEATSALDALTEYEIVKTIRERKITTIVVAHRLSTIRSCDEIIVLDHGSIVASGTHDELIKNCDFYNSLVRSE